VSLEFASFATYSALCVLQQVLHIALGPVTCYHDCRHTDLVG